MDYYEFRNHARPPSGTTSEPPEPATEDVPSTWRLVNLALGIAALIGFVRGMGMFPFSPSSWLSPGVITRGSLEELPRASLLAAQLGLDYYLLVSLILLAFLVTNTHRKLAAPKAPKAVGGLIAVWVTYVVLGCVAAWVSAQSWPDGAAGAMMFGVGLWLSPVILFALIAGVAGAVRELRALNAQPDGVSCSTRALVAWMLGPLLLSVLPVIVASSHPLERSMSENKRYKTLCAETSLELLADPAGPVRSIAFDWGPGYSAYSVPFYRRRYKLSSDGRILSEGGLVDPMYEGYGQQSQFDFVEVRMDRPADPAMPYQRMLRGDKAFYTAPSLTADAVAMLQVDTSKESSATGYRLTVTDRRSGEVLGAYTYVLDTKNQRACGSNMKGYVDPMGFINDAINR